MNTVRATNQVEIAFPLLVRPDSCRRSAWAFFLIAPLLFLLLVIAAGDAVAATDIKVSFTLFTTDGNGDLITENRYYYCYRPDNYPTNLPIPMILVMEASPASAPATFFHRKADQAGFVVVSCAIPGNSLGTVWNNDNPRVTGFEDYDYITAVINQVKLSDNCNDAFICGLSKGGHTAYAHACERPATIKAASSVDEFMGLTSNIPTAPVPIIAFHGTLDSNVPYTMGKDSVDAWRAIDGLSSAMAVTTYEAAPLLPGKVTQATWRGGVGGVQVAFVTIIGGTHQYALPGTQTGYDCTDGMWAFFSQFLTSAQAAPKIVSPPANNIQLSGQPASFRVAATGNAPLAYQWQKNNLDIPGATVNWFTVPATTVADNGSAFRVVVTNSSGSVTSAVATLTVNAAPANPIITTQPANQTVSAGHSVGLTVAATGTAPLGYQWKKNGMDIAGATASSLTMPAAITADCGANFSALVSNSAGSVTSAGATLTVLPAPGAPIIIANPVRARVLTNQTATLSVAAWSATPMSYQWQKGTFSANMVNIAGATNSTYTTPSTTLADHLTLFRCVVANSTGSVTSASEMLFVTTTMKPPTDITSTLTASGQVGVPFSYTIISSGGTTPLTFNASPLPAGWSVNPITGVISGTPAAEGTTQIVIAATNSAGNSPSRTLVLTVTMTPPVIPIDVWRSDHFGASATNPDIAGDLADPDGDGVKNLLEYAAGTDPLAAEVPSWLSFGLENGFLTVTAAKNPHATNLTWGAESSADFSVWSATNTTLLQNTTSLLKVRDNIPVVTNRCHFLRLKISEP
jgi:poly(3-hydroxybutyrate) depolymerase